MENDEMDTELRDNIDSAQFSERFPDETTLRPGYFRSEIDGVTEKSSSYACNELNDLQAH